MASLTVIASVVNLRLAPVEDLKNKGNVIGKLINGAPFESVNETTNKLGPWFQDVNGHWAWGGGLGTITAAPLPPSVKPEIAIGVIVENSLLTKLQIDQIWDSGETGEE